MYCKEQKRVLSPSKVAPSSVKLVVTIGGKDFPVVIETALDEYIATCENKTLRLKDNFTLADPVVHAKIDGKAKTLCSSSLVGWQTAR